MTSHVVDLDAYRTSPVMHTVGRSADDIADLMGRLADDLAEWHDEAGEGRGCWSCTHGGDPCPTVDLIAEARRARSMALHPSGLHPGGGGSTA